MPEQREPYDVDAYVEVAGDEDSADEDLASESEQQPAGDLPQWAEDCRVTVYGREFTIGPPDIGITLRILNVFGQLGVRGERVAMRALSSLARGAQSAPSPSARAALFGMLAAASVEDLIALGSAVLQFEDDREGRGFLRKPPEGHKLALSPLIRAMFLNFLQSEDLRDSLVDFFDGLRMAEPMLEGLSGDLA
jgi:hypothetical protein